MPIGHVPVVIPDAVCHACFERVCESKLYIIAPHLDEVSIGTVLPKYTQVIAVTAVPGEGG